MVALAAAELAAVVGQDRPDRQIKPGIERHEVIVQHLTWSLALDVALLEAGVELSKNAACSGLSSTARSAFFCSNASQRSWRVPSPLSLRIFWIVIADRRRPSNAKSASSWLQL